PGAARQGTTGPGREARDMAVRQLGLVLVAATLALPVSGTGVWTHRTRTRVCPGLPVYNYQYGTMSQPAIVVSLTAVPIRDGSTGVRPAGQERIKFYQLPQTLVQADHCFLSRVALTLT